LWRSQPSLLSQPKRKIDKQIRPKIFHQFQPPNGSVDIVNSELAQNSSSIFDVAAPRVDDLMSI
jgi:hypothetical protein